MSSKSNKRDSSSLLTSEEMPPLPLRKRKLEEPQQLLRAEELVIIPQIGGTCWFNVILTIILYSQMTRKVMLEEASKWTSGVRYEEMKRNKFMRFLYYMLTYNYTQPQKIAELFEKRLKAEFLILYFAEYYNYTKLKNELFKQLSANITLYTFYSIFISEILQNFFTNSFDILTIYYYEEQIFTISKKKKKDFLSYIPKIIILLNRKIIDFYLGETIHHKLDINDITSGIVNYEEEITFNGNTYKLDACIMNNYNRETEIVSHDICGITYNNQGYVYNGWINENNFFNKLTDVQYIKKSHCPLLPRDWKSDLRKPENTAGFCLPAYHIANCTSLAPLDSSEKYCFDFSAKTSFRTLIYVLVEETFQELLLSSFISLNGVVFSSKSLSPLLKTYFNFESKSLEELKIKLLKIYENLQLLVDELGLYKMFYFILTGERLSNYQITHSKDVVLKKLFIVLLKVYIKEDKIFKLGILTDDEIYDYLEKEQIIKIAVCAGYDRELITSFMTSSIIFDKYLILFYVVMNNLSKKDFAVDTSFIGLFIFYLCEYYLTETEILNFANYTDELILNNLSSQSIASLKERLKDTTDANLQSLITKLKLIDDEVAFEIFITNSENQLLIQEFFNENSIIKMLQERWFSNLSLKGLLILIIIYQYTFVGLYYAQLLISGGFFNKNKNKNKNNYKKVIKQLKNY
jgi:hypothetical protein